MSPRTRTLGAGGPAVHPVGLGAMGMSGTSYGPADEAEAIAAIHAALAVGVNHHDTADVYGRDGHNERLAGRALAGRRDAALVARGTVRHIGLSEAGAATVRRAHAVHPLAAVQSEYSLWWRRPETTPLPTLRELGIALVAFSPLGRGLLGGSVAHGAAFADDDLRRRLPRFQGGNLDRNLALAGVVRGIAAQIGATPGQVALAWLLRADPAVLPIPGVRTAARLRENAAAADLVLPDAVVDRLDAAFAEGAAAGERYPEDLARLIDP